MRRFTESTALSDFKVRFENWPVLLDKGLEYFSQEFPDKKPIVIDVAVLRRRLAGESFDSIAEDFFVSHQRIRDRERRMLWRIRYWELKRQRELAQPVV